MDDQHSYLLNGLLGRQFSLGRIVRFRQVSRGRQAVTYEVLTGEHREYLVHLFPAERAVDQLNFAADAVNALDDNRFSVVPFLKSSGGQFTAEGPQGTRLMVSLGTSGGALSPEHYTEHDISQVGLRLGWLHRLLREQLGEPVADAPLADRVTEALKNGHDTLGPIAGKEGGSGEADALLEMLRLPAAQGYVHGDFQTPALLHDDDHQLRTIVDWSLLHRGSPLEDLVDAFLALCRDREGRVISTHGRALLESYDSLLPIRRIPWTPVVASWLGQRILDAVHRTRPLPEGFLTFLHRPENLSAALASCI